jgi:DNA-binding CsgD family transcriptional regulator
LAAKHPQLVSALALLSTTACLRRVEGYDIGFPDGVLSRAVAEIADEWTGDGHRTVELQEPSHRGDGRYIQAASRYRRSTLSPGRARGLAARLIDLDVRLDCEGVGCPTVVVHRRHDGYIPPSHAMWLAAAIASAELHILPGDDHTPWAGGHDEVLDVITRFFTNAGVDLSARTRREVRFGWDAVTPAEHRVVERLAGGETIASAARALDVSSRTVETQLQSVYRKLDIRSRAALATALAEYRKDAVAPRTPSP